MIEQYKSLEELDEYRKRIHKEFKDGDTVYITDNKVYLVYDSATDKFEKNQNASIGISLYDLNKQIMAKAPKMTEQEENEALIKIYNYYDRKRHSYYMLLGHDLHYYTVFVYTNIRPDWHKPFDEQVLKCLKNIGEVLSIDDSDNGSMEIWVRTEDGEAHVLYLFPYNEGIMYFY